MRSAVLIGRRKNHIFPKKIFAALFRVKNKLLFPLFVQRRRVEFFLEQRMRSHARWKGDFDLLADKTDKTPAIGRSQNRLVPDIQVIEQWDARPTTLSFVKENTQADGHPESFILISSVEVRRRLLQEFEGRMKFSSPLAFAHGDPEL